MFTMSRSYKYAIFKCSPGKITKRRSSKKIRVWIKELDVGFKSSRQFKHQVNQYDLCDWVNIPVTYQKIQKAKRK